MSEQTATTEAHVVILGQEVASETGFPNRIRLTDTEELRANRLAVAAGDSEVVRFYSGLANDLMLWGSV